MKKAGTLTTLSRRGILAGTASLLPTLVSCRRSGLAVETAARTQSEPAQEPVTMRVDATAKLGPFKPIWAYVGYGGRQTLVYTSNAKKLIAELSEMSYVPVNYRTFGILSGGEDSPTLLPQRVLDSVSYDPPRSTSRYPPPSTVHRVYTEDPSGKPVYDWTIPDRVFDVLVQAHAKPLVTIGNMPEALSAGPNAAGRRSSLPKNYGKWAELVYQFVKHCAERYGASEAESWYWELWNEPDLNPEFTIDVYCKLWDYAAEALKRALPRARIGGPVSANFLQAPPRLTFDLEFMKKFLDHCANGTNAVSGKSGAPLDYINFHAKGNPRFVDGHVRMDIGRQMQRMGGPLEMVASHSRFRGLPVINSESDPEGCWICSASTNPQDGYRNGALYPCYNAVALSNTFKLADRHRIDLEGTLTLAFVVEGEPYFDGFRTLATNGIDKPVLNFFRMAGLMRGDRVKVESSGALGLDAILKDSVRQKPDIDAMAARSDHDITVMAWNYHDDDVPAPAAPIGMTVSGIPAAVRTVQLNHYRIDQKHSNSYTVWNEMGSPQKPTPEQYARLEAAGRLELLESPRWLRSEDGKVEISFLLPRQGVSLLQVIW